MMARKEFARGSCGRSETVVSGDWRTTGKRVFPFGRLRPPSARLGLDGGVGLVARATAGHVRVSSGAGGGLVIGPGRERTDGLDCSGTRVGVGSGLGRVGFVWFDFTELMI